MQSFNFCHLNWYTSTVYFQYNSHLVFPSFRGWKIRCGLESRAHWIHERELNFGKTTEPLCRKKIQFIRVLHILRNTWRLHQFQETVLFGSSEFLLWCITVADRYLLFPPQSNVNFINSKISQWLWCRFSSAPEQIHLWTLLCMIIFTTSGVPLP
jgi:hypothetical protein